MHPYSRFLAMGLMLLIAIPMPTAAQVFGTGVLPVTEVGANLTNSILNLGQNTLTAIRSFISNANEVIQIQHEVESLANEAKMLAQLPLSLVNEINAAIGDYTALLNQGRGIAFSVQSAVQQYEALYQSVGNGQGHFLQRFQRMTDQIRQAGAVAVQASSVFERLCLQQSRVGQLMAASQAAVGPLQAQQAAGQLLGVLAEQQISMQQLMATTTRLELSQALEDVVMNEQAYANAQAFLGGAKVVPMTGPGTNNGFALPR